MFAEQITIDTGLLTVVLSFLGLCVLGLVGWILSNAVRLGQVVAKLESTADDHERRLAHLETINS